jgi:hypothetical protein
LLLPMFTHSLRAIKRTESLERHDTLLHLTVRCTARS